MMFSEILLKWYLQGVMEMTGKLIKYELKSAIRQIGIVWVALIVMSVIVGFLKPSITGMLPNENIVRMILDVVPSVVFFGVFVASIVITIIIVVMRFYKGLLGDEGYLMHTLPVTARQLVVSKGLAAALVSAISIILATVSICLILGVSNFSMIAEFIKEFFQLMRENGWAVIILLEFIVLGITSMMCNIYRVYTSMSIGQLSGKHRVLASLGAYMGIYAITSVIYIKLLNAGTDLFVSMGNLETLEAVDAAKIALLITIACQVVELLILHFTTETLLKKKLNLL